MSEEENMPAGQAGIPPEEIPQEQPVNNEPTDETISSAEPIPEVDHPLTLNPQLSTSEDMEVHHHGHVHEKKKWKEYVFQFIMLFLAVFCGFLAEYQLEHKIERDRAKQLARSFYEELKNDSANVVLKTANRVKQEKALKYLMKYFKDSSLTNVSKTFALNFIYGINFRTPSLFEPRTVVLEQLKNSGSLRYFKSYELQKLIGDLSAAIYNIYDRQQVETDIRKEHINPLIVRHYDYDFDDTLKKNDAPFDVAAAEYEKSNEIIPFKFKSIEKFDKQGTINVLGFYKLNISSSTRRVYFQKYIEVNAELLKLLRKIYHLK